MKKIEYILLLLIIFAVSCKSTPEPAVEPAPDPTPEVATPEEPVQPVEEPSVVDVIEVEPEPVVIEEPVKVDPEPLYAPEPLDEALLLKARKEIFQAKEARADTYFPVRLNSLNDKLNQAIALKDEDPDKAREILKEITIESEQLIKESREALKAACIEILKKQTDSLIRIKADKYTVNEFNIYNDQKALTLEAFSQDDFAASLSQYRITYTTGKNLYDSLSTNMGYIDNLLRLINNYRVEGEAIDVQKWAEDEYNLAKESYIKSSDLLYNEFNAIDGEASLRETLFLAKKAVAQAKINIDVAKTDEDIFNLLNELEAASTLTILDKDDNIISPEAWEGKADLKEKPIEAEVEKESESGLTPIDLEKDVEVEYPIVEGESQVLGSMQERRTLLSEAKELWQLGIEARNNGDLVAAQEFLQKSKVYLDEYKSMAVDYIYTVILNPERRDCLWRISEKDEFYGDPFLWQNIWERNKKLIQDPDLIYPGWKLIIPPLED